MLRQYWKTSTAGYGLNEFLFSFYTAFILSAVYLVQILPALGNRLAFPAWFCLFAFLFLLVSLASRTLFRKLSPLHLEPAPAPLNQKQERIWFLCFFIAALLCMLPWYLLYYPGWFTGDSEWQMSQALSHHYNDWHPALQTFLTFTLPLFLTGGWKGSVVLFQIAEYALALAYMCTTFLKYGNRKYALASLILIALNPLTGAIVKQPWKDVTLAIFSVLLMSYALRIFYDPLWLKKRAHILLVAAVFAAGTIVRHNAVLFTAPLLLGILFLADRNAVRIRLLAAALVLFVLIKGPFYSLLGVDDPGRRSIETLGLPMTVIGNVVKQDPGSLDDETLAFAYSVAAPEDWERYYFTGDFNSIKFTDACNTQPVNDAGPVRVLGYMLRCFRASPARALEGLLSLTYMVYAVSGPINWTPEFFPPRVYSILNNSLFRYLSLYIGIPSFICLALTLSKLRLTSRGSWKKLFLIIPLFAHNWGTMLLLTGPDFRFFYSTFPLSCAVVFLLLND